VPSRQFGELERLSRLCIAYPAHRFVLQRPWPCLISSPAAAKEARPRSIRVPRHRTSGRRPPSVVIPVCIYFDHLLLPRLSCPRRVPPLRCGPSANRLPPASLAHDARMSRSRCRDHRATTQLRAAGTTPSGAGNDRFGVPLRTTRAGSPQASHHPPGPHNAMANSNSRSGGRIRAAVPTLLSQKEAFRFVRPDKGPRTSHVQGATAPAPTPPAGQPQRRPVVPSF
jgi:hypothetical protein